jgi:hypothetical protein
MVAVMKQKGLSQRRKDAKARGWDVARMAGRPSAAKSRPNVLGIAVRFFWRWFGTYVMSVAIYVPMYTLPHRTKPNRLRDLVSTRRPQNWVVRCCGRRSNEDFELGGIEAVSISKNPGCGFWFFVRRVAGGSCATTKKLERDLPRFGGEGRKGDDRKMWIRKMWGSRNANRQCAGKLRQVRSRNRPRCRRSFIVDDPRRIWYSRLWRLFRVLVSLASDRIMSCR